MVVEKFEKTLEVPACYISREIANRLAERIYAIAEDQAQAAYRQFLIQTAPRLGLTPEQAIQLHAENRSARDSFRKDRSTFISKEGSSQIEGRDVLYDEIPGDPDQVIVDVPGQNGRYLNITLSTDLMRVFPLHTFNKIIIQGQEKDWVNGLYQEFEGLFQTQKKVMRNFFYRWLRPLAFVAILFLSFIEFWLFRLVNPTFTAFTPLNGLAMVLVFGLLLLNWYLVFGVGARGLRNQMSFIEIAKAMYSKEKDSLDKNVARDIRDPLRQSVPPRPQARTLTRRERYHA